MKKHQNHIDFLTENSQVCRLIMDWDAVQTVINMQDVLAVSEDVKILVNGSELGRSFFSHLLIEILNLEVKNLIDVGVNELMKSDVNLDETELIRARVKVVDNINKLVDIAILLDIRSVIYNNNGLEADMFVNSIGFQVT